MDQGTMVRTGTSDTGTIRAASSVTGTMVERQGSLVESRLGTMVINSDDEDEEDEDDSGTMKSKRAAAFCPPGGRESPPVSSQTLTGCHVVVLECMCVCARDRE